MFSVRAWVFFRNTKSPPILVPTKSEVTISLYTSAYYKLMHLVQGRNWELQNSPWAISSENKDRPTVVINSRWSWGPRLAVIRNSRRMPVVVLHSLAWSKRVRRPRGDSPVVDQKVRRPLVGVVVILYSLVQQQRAYIGGAIHAAISSRCQLFSLLPDFHAAESSRIFFVATTPGGAGQYPGPRAKRGEPLPNPSSTLTPAWRTRIWTGSGASQ